MQVASTAAEAPKVGREESCEQGAQRAGVRVESNKEVQDILLWPHRHTDGSQVNRISRACVYVCVCVCLCVRACVRACFRVYLCLSVSVYMVVSVSVSVSVFLSVCLCVSLSFLPSVRPSVILCVRGCVGASVHACMQACVRSFVSSCVRACVRRARVRVCVSHIAIMVKRMMKALSIGRTAVDNAHTSCRKARIRPNSRTTCGERRRRLVEEWRRNGERHESLGWACLAARARVMAPAHACARAE